LTRTVGWQHRLGRSPQPHWLDTLADPPRTGPISAVVRGLPALLRTL